MDLKEELRKRLLDKQQLDQYNASKQALLTSDAGKAQTLSDGLTKQGFLSGSNAGSTADTAGALSNANNVASTAGNGIMDKAAGFMGKHGGAISSGLSLAGDVGNLVSGNGGAKDGINAGVDAASLGLNFVPVWGQAAAAALQIGKGIYNMFAGAQEAKDNEATQLAENTLSNQEKKKQEIMSKIQPNQVSTQLPQTQYQPTSVSTSMNTPLSIGQEAGYQISKAMSPFAKDSGYDYDLRGYYKNNSKNNNKNYDILNTQNDNVLTPNSINGHLTDEYKKPGLHPTYGTDWSQKGKMLEIPDTLQQGLELSENGYDYSKYMDNGPSLQELLEEKQRRGI